MRVEEYVLFRAKLKGVPRQDRAKRVDYCLERCRLREVRRRLLGTLSKGYRQRVGLADAMVHDPALLILDEPTSGLDPGQIRETLSLIRELGEERTVLLSTHILMEVEAICERVILIAAGSLRLDRSLYDIEAESVTHVEVQAPAQAVADALRPIGAGRDDEGAGRRLGSRRGAEPRRSPQRDRPGDRVARLAACAGWSGSGAVWKKSTSTCSAAAARRSEPALSPTRLKTTAIQPAESA